MAYEELWEIVKLVLWFAVIFSPLVYLLFAIRKRIETETLVKEIAVIFFLSLLLSLAVYPFIGALAQYIIALDYGLEVNLILFGSDYATYIVVLLFIFLVYLIVFNKTKEE